MLEALFFSWTPVWKAALCTVFVAAGFVEIWLNLNYPGWDRPAR